MYEDSLRPLGPGNTICVDSVSKFKKCQLLKPEADHADMSSVFCIKSLECFLRCSQIRRLFSAAHLLCSAAFFDVLAAKSGFLANF